MIRMRISRFSPEIRLEWLFAAIIGHKKSVTRTQRINWWDYGVKATIVSCQEDITITAETNRTA